MSFLKDLIGRLKHFFDTNLNLEDCVQDFKHADDLVKIKFNDLESNYKFRMKLEELQQYVKQEQEVERANAIELMLETVNVEFSKLVASLIKFTRGYVLLYCLKYDELTSGDIKHFHNMLTEIDLILKYEVIRLFNLKYGVELRWKDSRFIYPDNICQQDMRRLNLLKEIIEKNQQLIDAIERDRKLNWCCVDCEFQVQRIRQQRGFGYFNVENRV